ncbi:hypothetical protein BCR34DRAFT_66570 [Clohesyomyces aquaticus]|uniref:Uncharacterized protein n=1 Tax=Clohesyomyces aquaticus TaxID=1231657 RepID=A0A1Y1Z0N1_9PLEO|nr:hypothetical protein BCR34DRAFT_66570 [Clohesyomyces aquaticus]
MAHTRHPLSDKKEIQQFRETVESEKRNVKELLQKEINQAQKQHERRQSDIASAISEALLFPSADDEYVAQPQHTFLGTAIASNPIFESARELLKASGDLINEFDTMVEKEAQAMPQHETQLSEVWQQDVMNTEKRLELGYRVALRNVKKVLWAEEGKHEKSRGDENGDTDAEDVDGRLRVPLNYELQKALGYAERGVKRMVKTLPKDGTMDN